MTDTVRDAPPAGEAIRIDHVPRQGLRGLALIARMGEGLADAFDIGGI